jgi:uncharacterized protein YceH (UPF0502 family)
MHFSELTAPEQRVLGCLIEKRWTTPDQYPLSLNALRLACNQSTNRDPITHYDETTVREAAQRLSRYGLARLASGHGSRATKYRHLAEEALGLDRAELAALAVLLLRGPQTPGEIKLRSERMAPIESLSRLDEILARLSERGYARRLPRRPGQKEDRFEHLLGGAGTETGVPGVAMTGPAPSAAMAGPAPSAASAPSAVSAGTAPAPGPMSSRPPVGPATPSSDPRDPGRPDPGRPDPGLPVPGRPDPGRPVPAPDPALARRLEALEREVAELRAELAGIKAELGLEAAGEQAPA